MPYIIVLSCNGHDAEKKATDFIKSKVNRFSVKSKSAQKSGLELTYEVTGLVGWVCNWCHCFHDNPSQCYRPWLGGTWQYGTAQKVVTTYKKV